MVFMQHNKTGTLVFLSATLMRNLRVVVLKPLGRMQNRDLLNSMVFHSQPFTCTLKSASSDPITRKTLKPLTVKGFKII